MSEKKPEMVWECNECGAQEYSIIISGADIQELGCGKCGASEWHQAEDNSEAYKCPTSA